MTHKKNKKYSFIMIKKLFLENNPKIYDNLENNYFSAIFTF